MWRKKIFSMFIGLLLVLTRVPLMAFLGALLAFFLVVSSADGNALSELIVCAKLTTE